MSPDPDARADRLRDQLDQHLPEDPVDDSAHVRLSRVWDKAAPWIVAVMAVLFFVSVVGNFILEYDANKSQNNHHAASIAQQDEIIHLVKAVQSAQQDHAQTLNEVARLQKQVNAAFAEGVPALEAGQNEVVSALNWIECSLATSAGQCGPAPKMP